MVSGDLVVVVGIGIGSFVDTSTSVIKTRTTFLEHIKEN